MKFRVAGVIASLVLCVALGLNMLTSPPEKVAKVSVEPAVHSHGIGCNTANAEEISGCVSRLFNDPTSPYSPSHVHTPAEKQPAPGPRVEGAGHWQMIADANIDGDRINAVHVSLTRHNKVLITAGSGNNPNEFAAGTFKTFLWDLGSNAMTKVETPKDLFCSGHTLLPDGRVLFFGGTEAYSSPESDFKGSRTAYAFDDLAAKYVQLPDMGVGRWYPNGTVDTHGNVVVVGGFDGDGKLTDVNEAYLVHENRWVQLPSRLFPLYPHMVTLASGEMFYSGVHVFGRAGVGPGIWNAGTNDWRAVEGLPDIDCRDQGVGLIMYPAQAQKVIAIGGGCEGGLVGSTGIADLAAPQPQYVPGPPLPFAAMHLCGLNLPDKSLFVSGGGDHNVHPILRSAVLKQGAPGWEEVTSPHIPRMYHSNCILTEEGAVMTLGSNPGDGFETGIELYRPWYMDVPRPTINADIGALKLGEIRAVPFGSGHGLSEAMLIRKSSTTHSSDPNLRAVHVPVKVLPDGQAELVIEHNAGILPPGPYLLFLLDESGVPSVGKPVLVNP